MEGFTFNFFCSIFPHHRTRLLLQPRGITMNLLLNSGRSSRARVIFQSLNLTFQLRNVGSRKPSERKKNAIVALAAPTTTVRLEIIFIQNQELSCCV